MSVISRILELMENEGISARKLTAELGLANSCISEWKKEKAKPSIDAIIKISAYFGVTTDYLLLEEPRPESAESNNSSINTSNILINKDEKEAVGSAVIEESAAPVRNYRSHMPYREGAKLTAEVSDDEMRLLECYKKLDEEDKEYIRCKVVVLNRESMDS